MSARPGPARHAFGHRRRPIAPARLGPALGAAAASASSALAGALTDEARATRRVLLRADWVYDDALVRGLVAAERTSRCVADDGMRVALSVAAPTRADAAALLAARRAAGRRAQAVSAAVLADGYNDALRKREPPYLMPLSAADAAGGRAARLRRLLQGRDRPRDALRLAAPARCGDALVRARRHHAEPGHVREPAAGARGDVRCSGPATTRSGLVAAWAMTFLDTVDGKLARVTLRSIAVRQRLRPLDRPDPSAVLVVGLDRRPAGRGPAARATPRWCSR